MKSVQPGYCQKSLDKKELFLCKKITYSQRIIKKKKIDVMKILFESIRNFWEGFISFYTSLYNLMKSW
jgi:hypothetical protein